MNPELTRLLNTDLVVSRREHPELSSAMYYAAEQGQVTMILPGIAVPADQHADWRVLALAACKLSPHVVVTGPAALNLALGTSLPVITVDAFAPHRVTSGPIEWHRRQVPPGWRTRVGPVHIASPAWAAVDMCGNGDASPLDLALHGGVPLTDLWAAFRDMKGHPGNKMRRQLLIDSRDIPWSAAERLAHRVLRNAGITGWRTNRRVAQHIIDIVFPQHRLGLEVDGFEYHSSRTSFERDRRRDQDLLGLGWTVMRVTWAQLNTEQDRIVATVRRALRRRQAP